MKEGETEAWLMLAHELKLPLQRVQRETTSSEFVLWKVFLDKLWNVRTKTDHYLAQIALEVRRSGLTKRRRLSLKEFFITFTRKRDQDKPEPAEWAKARWRMMLGGQPTTVQQKETM